MGIHLIYSRRHNGWYAEVYYRVDGATAHKTDVYQDKELARESAEKWLRF